MHKIILFITIIIIDITQSRLLCCTAITKSDSANTMVGFNMDWMISDYEIIYTPPTDSQYGRICFGMFEVPLAGGINDQGLFWFPPSVNNIPIKEMRDKALYRGDFIFDDLMAKCSNVKEAINFLSKYDLSNTLESVHLMLVDKSGDWAIFEGDDILTKNQNFCVLENISILELPEKHILCRHHMAYNLLEKSDITIDSFRHILSMTCQGTRSYCPTQFSAIFDLTNFKINIYHFQNFTEALIVDIKKEMKKDTKIEKLSELFSTKWSFLNENGKKRISEVFHREIKNHNVDIAIKKYRALEKNAKDKYEFDNWDLDFVGFSCMYNQRFYDALKIFELNLQEYPDYAYGYYNLGRIYHKLGENEKAVNALRKSIELDSTRSVTIKYLNHLLKYQKN